MAYFPQQGASQYGWYPQYQPQQMYPSTFSQQVPQPMLNGKIVDGIEVVRAAEVPMGGYGIFPKADLTKIYIKIWDNNKNETRIIEYNPNFEQEQTQTQTLIQKVDELNKKVDALVASATQQNNDEVTF